MKTVEIEIPIGYEIDKEKSTFEKIVFKKIKSEWVDLGLPSGNLWKSANEDGYFTYNDAVEKFKGNLPTIVDFAELVQYCKWKWSSKSREMVVTGPNKNQITFSATGFRSRDNGSIYDNGIRGYYWSASPYPIFNDCAYYLYLGDGCVYPSDCETQRYQHSVRCVKHK